MNQQRHAAAVCSVHNMIISMESSFVRSCLFVAILCFISFLETSAFPGQAGHCNKGSFGNQSGYIGPHGSSTGGSLTTGKYFVKIDGEVIENTETVNLDVGTEYTVTLTGDSKTFKGFLLRIEDENEVADLSGLMTVVSEDHMKVHELCSGKEVSAVTHKLNDDKTDVEFKLKFDEPVDMVRLDATVVRSKAFGNWFYSLFYLKVAGGEPGEESEEPSASPSTIPSTFPSTIPSPSPPSFCVNSPLIMLQKGKERNCVKRLNIKAKRRCRPKTVRYHCPLTCQEYYPNLCDKPTNSKADFLISTGNAQNCAWVKARRRKRCKLKSGGVAKTCRNICINYL